MRLRASVVLLVGGAAGYGSAAIASAGSGNGGRAASYGLVAGLCVAGLVGLAFRRSRVARVSTTAAQVARVVAFLAFAGVAAAIGALGIGDLARGAVTMQAEIQAFTGVIGALAFLAVAAGLAWYAMRDRTARRR